MRATTAANSELIAIYTQDGVNIDTQETKSKNIYKGGRLLADFKTAPNAALLYFGFENADEKMTESLAFLHGLCAFFVERLSKNPDLDITRSAPPLGRRTVIHCSLKRRSP